MIFLSKIKRSSKGVPIGTPIIYVFYDIIEWVNDQDWIQNTDYFIRVDQEQHFVYCTWHFTDRTKALILKLTWGGQ